MTHAANPRFPTFRRLLFGRERRASPLRSWWPWYTTSSQRHSLLRLIAAATEEHLPLGPAIEAWAADESGVQQRRLHRLARLLKEGTPLPEAIEQVPGALRDADVLAIRFGAQSGALAAVIREALDDTHAASTGRIPLFRRTVIYVGAVSIIGLLIVTFIHIKIAPVLLKILADYSSGPPSVLLQSEQLADTVANYWLLGGFGALALLWFTCSARPGRFVRYAIFAQVFRPLRDLQSAVILRQLSVTTHSGRPISGALSTLARYHFDPGVRHKLLFVRNEVEQGANVWQSMATARLLTAPEAELMRAADRAGNRPWTLKQLAAGKQRRTARFLERLSELCLPSMVLIMGAFVLFQALTVFLPMIQLLGDLL